MRMREHTHTHTHTHTQTNPPPWAFSYPGVGRCQWYTHTEPRQMDTQSGTEGHRQAESRTRRVKYETELKRLIPPQLKERDGDLNEWCK